MPGASFKRSVEKDVAELEFVAVNLHLQRMAVSSDPPTSPGAYPCVCVCLLVFSGIWTTAQGTKPKQERESWNVFLCTSQYGCVCLTLVCAVVDMCANSFAVRGPA